MLPGFNNILCSLPIDALRLCIYLACHLRKRFILLFRLATGWLLSRTAPFQNFLGVGSAKSSQTATWTPGNWVCRPSSLWATSIGASRPVQDLLAGKGAHLEFSLSRKVTTLGLWNNQPLTTRIEQNQKHRDRLSLPIKRK